MDEKYVGIVELLKRDAIEDIIGDEVKNGNLHPSKSLIHKLLKLFSKKETARILNMDLNEI